MHFTYDERNLPIEIGGFSYRYNADGHRYLSDVGGTQTFYVMDGTRNAGVFRTNSTGQWELRYWNIFGNGLEGRREEGTEHRFYHKDHLGSTRAVVNASGTTVEAYDYYPFGMELPGRSYTAGSPTHEKFTGHQRDEEVDLDYMIWRRYDPAFPVFMSVDPMAHKYPWVSPYVYALNNPLLYVDPDGREIEICNGIQRNSEGSECFTYEPGKEYGGNDTFIIQTIAFLDKIHQGGSTGRGLVNYLVETDERRVTIFDSRLEGRPRQFRDKNRADGSNGEWIFFNPDKDEVGITRRGKQDVGAFIALAHELAHIEDEWKGTIDFGIWLDDLPGRTEPVLNSEKYASYIENKIRAEHGIPLRSHYALEEYNGVMRGYGPSRILNWRGRNRFFRN